MRGNIPFSLQKDINKAPIIRENKSNRYKIELGMEFKMGKPTNESYLFIHVTPKSEDSDSIVSAPKKLLNQIVVITGILELSNSKQKIIMGKRDKTDFYSGLHRIYVDIDQAIVAKELIPL